MKQQSQNSGQLKSVKGINRKPEIRDNLDSRKNEEYRTKGQMKKAEIQEKEKQKNNKTSE